MGSTMNPRARGGASLQAELKASRADRQQIRRLMAAPPKPAAPVAAGGGVIGMAQVVAASGSVTWAAGQVEMNYGAVTYNTPTDPNSGSGGGESSVAVSSWLTVSDHLITVTPGWYIPVLYMRVTWATPGECPSAFGGPYTNGGWDSVHNDYGIHPAVQGGFVQIANYGPTYMGAGTNFHAELRSVGGMPTGANSPASSAIVWNITKLG